MLIASSSLLEEIENTIHQAEVILSKPVFNWGFCDRQFFCEPNCGDVLFQYLVDVTDSLRSQNVTYYIHFGTLIGSVRDQDIIPWETDIDIVVPDLSFTQIIQILKSPLRDKGYVIFKNGIVRICKRSRRTLKNVAPWNKIWFAYVDLYTEKFIFRRSK